MPALAAPCARGFIPPLDACHILHSPSDAISLARSCLAWYHFFAVFRPEYFRARFFVFKPVFSPRRPRLRQKHQDHAVAAEEEFADEAVAVDGLALLAVRIPGDLAPHLLDVLQDHVAVAIEGFDAREQFAVVAGGNEDLGVVAHGGLEEREGA